MLKDILLAEYNGEKKFWRRLFVFVLIFSLNFSEGKVIKFFTSDYILTQFYLTPTFFPRQGFLFLLHEERIWQQRKTKNLPTHGSDLKIGKRQPSVLKITKTVNIKKEQQPWQLSVQLVVILKTRPLKTWLKSTMKNQRFHSLQILSIYGQTGLV